MNSNESAPESAVSPIADLDADMVSVDLPPYHIILACTTLGFAKPLDCYWSAMPALVEGQASGQTVACACAEHRRIGSRWSGLRTSAPIQVFTHRCMFNDNGGSTIYRMGQCPACNTIYWAKE